MITFVLYSPCANAAGQLRVVSMCFSPRGSLAIWGRFLGKGGDRWKGSWGLPLGPGEPGREEGRGERERTTEREFC